MTTPKATKEEWLKIARSRLTTGWKWQISHDDDEYAQYLGELRLKDVMFQIENEWLCQPQHPVQSVIHPHVGPHL